MSSLNLGQTTLSLRELPPNTYLVHATNCMGVWGSGVAKALGDIFPYARAVYQTFCDSHKPTTTARFASRALAGRCLVIPPQEGDGVPGVTIVCLFTSYGGGAGRDDEDTIMAQTAQSLGEFRESLDQEQGEPREADGGSSVVVYSPRFNSGIFGIPWDKTAALIREHFNDWDGQWMVLTPP